MSTATQQHAVLDHPRDLGDGLTLRWATPEDIDAIATFNAALHTDAPGTPDPFLERWTRDLMGGAHPTTGATDFTVVTDAKRDGAVVSTLCLISQTWSYDGIPFGVGRPELVGTDPAYRRRGLIRLQFEAIHALSAGRGEQVQAITGIPWYYRQFGYEMAVDLEAGGRQALDRVRPLKDGQEERYQLRRATTADIPLLQGLYERACALGPLARIRSEAEWLWELRETPEHNFHAALQIIEDRHHAAIGYSRFRDAREGRAAIVREIMLAPGHDWCEVCAFLARSLKAGTNSLNRTAEKPLAQIIWELGMTHPAYDALGDAVQRPEQAYTWYLRVPDLPAFIRHIGPALERRLAGSLRAGYTGVLRLNFYTSTLTVTFANGMLAEVGSFTPERLQGGDALFPDLTFLQLLFGHRSMADLQHARPDCYAEHGDIALLLDSLFPRRPSNIQFLS